MQDTTNYCQNYPDTKLSFDQDVIYRQENLPRGRTFRIFPPTSKKCVSPISHKFNIATIKNRENLQISNLPLDERACLQKYDIKCNVKNYNLMISSTKYIFDAFTFNFDSKGLSFNKTHYFSIAPSLANEDTNSHLPSIYRTSICTNIDNPQHFSFSTYAIVGGYADGFYFMNRLDNNRNEFAHICKDKTKNCNNHYPHKKHEAKVIPFPHMHQPSFDYEKRNKCELSTPYHLPHLKDKNMLNCFSFYLKYNNIAPKMLLMREDMQITDVVEYIKQYDLKQTIEDTTLGQLGKVVLTDIVDYEISTEYNDHSVELPTQECGAPYLRT